MDPIFVFVLAFFPFSKSSQLLLFLVCYFLSWFPLYFCWTSLSNFFHKGYLGNKLPKVTLLKIPLLYPCIWLVIWEYRVATESLNILVRGYPYAPIHFSARILLFLPDLLDSFFHIDVWNHLNSSWSLFQGF